MRPNELTGGAGNRVASNAPAMPSTTTVFGAQSRRTSYPSNRPATECTSLGEPAMSLPLALHTRRCDEPQLVSNRLTSVTERVTVRLIETTRYPSSSRRAPALASRLLAQIALRRTGSRESVRATEEQSTTEQGVSMKHAYWLGRWVLPSSFVLTACGAAVSTTGSQQIENVSAQDVQGPFVAAGTPLTVSMDTPLDTMSSAAGQSFTATVQTPLRSADGAIIVPQGAKVHGVLASSGTVDHPRLRLDLQSVDTADGSAPIQASVRHASRTDYAGPTEFAPTGDDPFLYPYDSAAWGWWGPMGGGPLYDSYTPTEIRVPRGASMQLVLTRPLIPPGSAIR